MQNPLRQRTSPRIHPSRYTAKKRDQIASPSSRWRGVKSYGDKTLLDSLSFGIEDSERIGLIESMAPTRGQLYRYPGDYESFLEGKLLREENALATEQKRQNFLRNELTWIQRVARAGQPNKRRSQNVTMRRSNKVPRPHRERSTCGRPQAASGKR